MALVGEGVTERGCPGDLDLIGCQEFLLLTGKLLMGLFQDSMLCSIKGLHPMLSSFISHSGCVRSL